MRQQHDGGRLHVVSATLHDWASCHHIIIFFELPSACRRCRELECHSLSPAVLSVEFVWQLRSL